MPAVRHRKGTSCCAAVGLSLTLVLAGATTRAGSSEADKGTEIMRGLDRASYLYLDSALRFACEEKIVERSPGWMRSHKFDYLFVYDKGHGFQDYRTNRGKQPGGQVDPAAQGVKRFLARAYMWVLVFNRSRQARFRYRLLGEEEMHGVPAVKIGFEPIPPFEEEINDWFGTAWVDPIGLQILRVEAMKSADHEQWGKIEKAAKEGILEPGIVPGSTYRVNRVTTDFTVVKNEMRFPGEVRIVSTIYYLPAHGSSRRIEELLEERSTQTYSKYRFYGVRTSEEIRKILEAPSGKRKRGTARPESPR